jgi:flagellar basal-body rod protein FlgB
LACPSLLKYRTLEPKWLITRSDRFGREVAHVDGVVDATTNNIERYMDLLADRQKLVVSNIANIDTPGYKSKDIDFQFEFISMGAGGSAENRSAENQSESPNVIDAPGLVVKSDGNNVSLDRETRLLAETALRFNVASSLMKAQLKIVQSAIKEGQS